MEDRSVMSVDPMFLKGLKPIGYRLTDPHCPLGLFKGVLASFCH